MPSNVLLFTEDVGDLFSQENFSYLLTFELGQVRYVVGSL